ncbi:ABC transporter substrate-binding protein [Malaciobacter marinus]|uniref:ABC transporter substrate-binding protein n=1 Tax=Malaciobacter marinus TaxID=505249 RepID=A0A347TNV9_9BACT|nr:MULTISPECIES: ABC transporter substrate-binding protein [Malaciobacter]AXX88287.1 putative periplasmic binding protein [Malaciobacter marinus]PHO14630.1 ABC transporter substrate-binding protein [Malaciobacter marinus]RYA23250.1 ABC transporter substrate-binding protein [Malaciobacter halophilus]
MIYKILFYLFFINIALLSDTRYREDDAHKISLAKQIKGSHIKVFIPTMPYLYLSKLINGTLIRSADNENGWEFMLATNLKRVGDLEYIFTLRDDVKFQDGTKFDAKSVIDNFEEFMKGSMLYKPLRSRLEKIEKLASNKIKFTLNKPYELFLDRLTRFNFFSSVYLKKFGWGIGNIDTAVNTLEPGKYGLGPYILEEGYATGREQTAIIKIRANPYYYEKNKPYIEKITIYTELSNEEVLNMALKEEGGLDISPIPFNKKVETILSSYSKLVTSKSKHNISILFNLLKKDTSLKDKRVRIALNEAIDQEKLLKFVYKGEGQKSPTAANTNYYSVNLATKDLLTHHEKMINEKNETKKYLKSILNGLELNVYTMDRYMFLWKGIEFQLLQYGVKLNYIITKSEKELFSQLFSNIKNPKKWDMITLGTESWSSNNPWTVFFHYRINNIWSAIDKDEYLSELINKYSEVKFNSEEFLDVVDNIIHRVYEKAYTLAVPSPNIVLAVNKEVDYVPPKVLIMPLWNTKITPFHHSIRKTKYSKDRMLPILPKVINEKTTKD